jgi:hypothetical protein
MLWNSAECFGKKNSVFASYHHHPQMQFHYFFLLLLVVLSAYHESPDSSVIPLSQHNTSVLGGLAPVLPQREMLASALPQNGVYNIIQPLEGVYNTVQLQNGVFKFVMPQKGVPEFVLCHLFNMDASMDFLLNLGVKSFNFLTSNLSYHGEKSAWAIRILLECLQHVFKMYTWSLSENQASVQFRCRLTGLLLKKSLFRKHDFAAYVHRVYHCDQNLCFQHLKIFSAYVSSSSAHVREEHTKISNQFLFYGGGKALIFSSDELHPYTLGDLQEKQYQFLQCVKKDNNESIVLGDGDILCSMPLNILTPKLTLKTAKKLSLLHKMYMP